MRGRRGDLGFCLMVPMLLKVIINNIGLTSQELPTDTHPKRHIQTCNVFVLNAIEIKSWACIVEFPTVIVISIKTIQNSEDTQTDIIKHNTLHLMNRLATVNNILGILLDDPGFDIRQICDRKNYMEL